MGYIVTRADHKAIVIEDGRKVNVIEGGHLEVTDGDQRVFAVFAPNMWVQVFEEGTAAVK